MCLYCQEIDTIEHYFFECPESAKLWRQIENFVENFLEIKFPLTVCAILFGIPNTNETEIKIINFLIIITKWYINKNKTENRELYFLSLLSLVKEKIEIVKYINIKNNTPHQEWHEMLSEIL